jgi:hypothetical protein
VKQLVTRGHLHSVQAPEDRRRRRVFRSEVEAYARAHAGKWSYALRSPAQGTAPLASPTLPGISPQAAQAGAAGVAAAVLMIAALRAESDAALKLLLIGALVGIALLLILEWRRQGHLDAAQARHLERLAKSAEATPEQFVAELEQVLAQAR